MGLFHTYDVVIANPSQPGLVSEKVTRTLHVYIYV